MPSLDIHWLPCLDARASTDTDVEGIPDIESLFKKHSFFTVELYLELVHSSCPRTNFESTRLTKLDDNCFAFVRIEYTTTTDAPQINLHCALLHMVPKMEFMVVKSFDHYQRLLGTSNKLARTRTMSQYDIECIQHYTGLKWNVFDVEHGNHQIARLIHNLEKNNVAKADIPGIVVDKMTTQQFSQDAITRIPKLIFDQTQRYIDNKLYAAWKLAQTT
jgi:hypothetical protein